MSLSLELPENYGYVLLVAVSTFFVNLYHAHLTGRYRTASGVKYPAAYASNEHAEKDPRAFAFNCAQRAHQQFTENHTSFLGALLLSGVQYPIASAILGAGWVASRIAYAYGYTTSGPVGRLRGSYASLLTDMLLKLMSIYNVVRIIMRT